jgi:hypothetical protein
MSVQQQPDGNNIISSFLFPVIPEPVIRHRPNQIQTVIFNN